MGRLSRLLEIVQAISVERPNRQVRPLGFSAASKAVVVDIACCHAGLGISEEFRTLAGSVSANLVDNRHFATKDFDTPSAAAACRTGR